MLIAWAHQQIAGATSAPVNSDLPVVTGDTVVGQALAATDGTWTGNPEPTLAYQWQRDSADIASAAENTYTLVEDDLGAMIRIVVTATNFRGSASANSEEVGPVTTA